MPSTESAPRGEPGGSASRDGSLATTLPVMFGIVLIALALTESYGGLPAAVAAWASAHLILRRS